MDVVRLRRRLATTRLAYLVTLVPRVLFVGRHVARTLRFAGKWIVHSHEHTNLTYDLTERNVDQLAWFISEVADTPVQQIRAYLSEIQGDQELRDHVRTTTQSSSRRGLADLHARFGRRMGWYALVRALQPELVVETGTDKGLGSCVIAAALLRNGKGRLLTLDVNPESGFLIAGKYAEVVDHRIGDSIAQLVDLQLPVDVFLHDSDHSAAHESKEFDAVASHLTPASVALSDNSHVTAVLSDWAQERGWQFSFFAEEPADHWYTGDGIGAARATSRSAPPALRTG